LFINDEAMNFHWEKRIKKQILRRGAVMKTCPYCGTNIQKIDQQFYYCRKRRRIDFNGFQKL
jgi:hypothetical protein